jgi:hypothetical protein
MRIVSDVPGVARRFGRPALGVAAALGCALAAAPALAKGRTCSATASAQYGACKSEVKDDFLTRRAVCLNLPEPAARDACLDAAGEERRDGSDECREQLDARRDLCDRLGEEPYAPSFAPADFDGDFGNPTQPNPHFPLGIGHSWDYAGGDEAIHVEVLDESKLIEGVTCIVVRDRVEVAGVVVEDTDDWFGQRKDGTVDYCGEVSQSFELFPGDDPAEPELVELEGSWKAFRDGALPGTLFPGAPAVGQVYRQEWSPGTAEDAAEVLSTSYGFGGSADLDALVPQALAELLCAAQDCVVTKEFTPLEPDGLERKYYAPGIGLFLEVSPEGGDVVQLVDCSFDARCATLPTP